MVVRVGTMGWLPAVTLALAAVTLAAAAPASASVGYELNASTPSHAITGVPHGIAVDQADRRIYVAVITTEPATGGTGQIDRFESNLAAAGVFKTTGTTYYTGVAVNPVTQGFYAAQALLHTQFGNFGTPEMDVFTSAGTAGTPFALSDNEILPQIAADSNGDVYYPNPTTHSVKVFNTAGTLQEEVTCGGCPGGSFGMPVSVAIDSDDDLYVVDLSPDRVIKFTLSGGAYSFASVLQSGRGAAAVGVDPSGDEVFVGDLPGGKDYHIIAYDSTGAQFDDFGAGLFTNPEPPFSARIAVQIGVDATSHRLYVGDVDKFYIFDKVTIHPPTAAIKTPAPVGQLRAKLKATVNPEGHAAADCRFEYTDDADFQANGFGNATDLECPNALDGTGDKEVTAEAMGLSPTTVYHYRITVTTNAGTTTSAGETFETLPVVPVTITPEPPTTVNQTDAIIRGKVNPHGGSVSNCHFEYGASTAYGSTLSCTVTPGPVSTDVAESRKIASLTASTTYHYRLVVTSNAGTVQGDDVEFTTASPPPPETGEPPVTTPLPPAAPPVTETPPPPPPPVSHPLRCRKGFQKKRVRGKLKCVKKRKHKHRASKRRSGG